MLGQAAAIAAGRGFLGERVHHSVPAWVLNLEDPLDEMHRRLAALMTHHKVSRGELDGRLFLHSGRTRRVSMATFGTDRVSLVHPDREAIVAACLAEGIGLLVVDPFVKSHQLDENSNAQIDAAVTAWAEIAEATGAAVLLVHHVRKGTGGIGDVESARGAKSLSDAARAAFVLAPMSPEEAARLDIPPAERWRHVRLDDAKANLAPRGEAALWYRLETVALGNATASYPSGDQVAVIAPWQQPAFPAVMTPARGNAALDRIAAGPEPGLAYTAHSGGRGGERWAGHVLIEAFGLSDAEAGPDHRRLDTRGPAAGMPIPRSHPAKAPHGSARDRRPSPDRWRRHPRPPPVIMEHRMTIQFRRETIPAANGAQDGACSRANDGAADGASRLADAHGVIAAPCLPGLAREHGARGAPRPAQEVGQSLAHGAAHGARPSMAHGIRRGAARGAAAGTLQVDAQLIIYRLEEAGRTLLSLPPTGYTTKLRTSSIDLLRSALDGHGWEAPGGEGGKLRPPVPPAARITRMDEAFGWVVLIPRDRFVIRRIVGCRALVSPVTERHLFTWRRIGTLLGADHKAIQRWHAQGIDMIVAAVNAAR